MDTILTLVFFLSKVFQACGILFTVLLINRKIKKPDQSWNSTFLRISVSSVSLAILTLVLVPISKITMEEKTVGEGWAQLLQLIPGLMLNAGWLMIVLCTVTFIIIFKKTPKESNAALWSKENRIKNLVWTIAILLIGTLIISFLQVSIAEKTYSLFVPVLLVWNFLGIGSIIFQVLTMQK